MSEGDYVLGGIMSPYHFCLGPLASHPPMKSLIGLAPITSLCLQIVTIVAFQVLGLLYTQNQDWFVPFDYENPTYVNTTYEDYYSNSTISDSEVRFKF